MTNGQAMNKQPENIMPRSDNPTFKATKWYTR